MSDYRFKIGDFAPTGADWSIMSGRRGRHPTNHSFSQKTRLNVLSYGVKFCDDFSSVLSEFTRLTDARTDRRTDRILIARPRLHSMQRGKKQEFRKQALTASNECAFTLHYITLHVLKREGPDIRAPTHSARLWWILEGGHNAGNREITPEIFLQRKRSWTHFDFGKSIKINNTKTWIGNTLKSEQ